MGEVNSIIMAALSVVVIMAGFFLTLHADRKLSVQGHLVMAAGYGMQVVGNLLYSETRMFVAIPAALMAWSLYQWWNNGGGDGLKRRLKSWAQSFGGASPQTA